RDEGSAGHVGRRRCGRGGHAGCRGTVVPGRGLVPGRRPAMTTSPYDAYRPPDGDRRRRRGRGGDGRGGARGAGGRGGRRGGRGGLARGAAGGREMPPGEDGEFTSSSGRPIVKAPPWGDETAAYLFLGGLAGGSALLGLGAQLTDRPALRSRTRLTALAALGL